MSSTKTKVLTANKSNGNVLQDLSHTALVLEGRHKHGVGVSHKFNVVWRNPSADIDGAIWEKLKAKVAGLSTVTGHHELKGLLA